MGGHEAAHEPPWLLDYVRSRHLQEGDVKVDRGNAFDGVRIGRPAVGGLIDAGFTTINDLPDDLGELMRIHGVGLKAIELLREARSDRRT
jgi:hypothetical protein